MRISLFILLCTVSFPASAQWALFKKHERLPLLEKARWSVQIDHTVVAIQTANSTRTVYSYQLGRSDFSLEAEEAIVMKTAQHNMRYRQYQTASYNFNELASLYTQQNRFSEAKWYFLQSCLLSRQFNNDKLTILNLSNLAMVKSSIGDFILAQQDLVEARNIAAAHGWLIDILAIEKKLGYIQHNRFASLNTTNRYAELASAN
jgi:hypothetical protein